MIPGTCNLNYIYIIVIVIGGQYFGWNYGLTCGFGGFAMSTLLVGIAFICLMLCLAEIASALPFSGYCDIGFTYYHCRY